jgi:hypothetical protein
MKAGNNYSPLAENYGQLSSKTIAYPLTLCTIAHIMGRCPTPLTAIHQLFSTER